MKTRTFRLILIACIMAMLPAVMGYKCTDDMSKKDKDGDGYSSRPSPHKPADCNDNDPNNWRSCASCADSDGDGSFTGCDAYATILGPDCDDLDPDNWTSCATCGDSDQDGFFAECDAYVNIAGPDCDDGDSTVWPGAPETCDDGVDSDCDGCGCIDYQLQGPILQVTDGEANRSNQVMVWTGSEYGLAWQDDRDGNDEIYFALIAGDGASAGGTLRVTADADPSLSPSLAWTGSEFGLAWSGPGIYFQRLSAEGAIIGDAIVVAATGTEPSLAWTGSEFGLAFSDSTEALFIRLMSNGTLAGQQVMVAHDTYGVREPVLAWTGSEYGMLWKSLPRVYYGAIYLPCPYPYGDNHAGGYVNFTGLTQAGDTLGTQTSFLAFGTGMSLLWTEPGFGVAASACYPPHFSKYGVLPTSWPPRFVMLMISDEEISYHEPFSVMFLRGVEPTIAWTGSEFGVSWVWTKPYKLNMGIYFSRFSADRVELQVPTLVAPPLMNGPDISPHGGNRRPSMVWNGSSFAIVWQEHPDSWPEYDNLVFARLNEICEP
ncbi:MAG TPA: putative metal-binding motif-containing protein [bacterium]|nr:putative metal-binding motif-containing protein [bacterium]